MRSCRFIHGKELLYPFNRRLGEPRSLFWMAWSKEKSITLAGIRTVDCPVCNVSIFLTRWKNYSVNNNNIYLLQLGCYPVAVVILHVYKT